MRKTNPISGQPGPRRGRIVRNEPNPARLGQGQVPSWRKMQNKANFGRAGYPSSPSFQYPGPTPVVQNKANDRHHADREISVPGGLRINANSRRSRPRDWTPAVAGRPQAGSLRKGLPLANAGEGPTIEAIV